MTKAPIVPRMRKMSARKAALLATLDVGASKVVCLISRLSPSGGDATNGSRSHHCRILGVGHQKSRGVKAGAVVDLDSAERSIRLAVDSAERMAGVEVRHVIVNISGGRLASQRRRGDTALHGRPISEVDIHRALDSAAKPVAEANRTILHAIPTSFLIDAAHAVRDAKGMLGETLAAEMNFVSSDSAAIRNLLLAVERCHLQASAIVASPYAAGLSTLADDEAELGAALVDFGGGSTSVGIFSGGRLVHVDAVAVGGNHVTMDVARGLSISLADAERLKALHGACISSPSDDHEMIAVHKLGEDMDHPSHLPKSELVHIIKPRVEEILELVRDRIKASGFSAQSGRKLVLTGGGSQLTGLIELSRQIVSSHVRAGAPIGFEGLPEAARNPAFAVSVGLTVYPQVVGAEFSSSRPSHSPRAEPDSYVARVGRWIRESF